MDYCFPGCVKVSKLKTIFNGIFLRPSELKLIILTNRTGCLRMMTTHNDDKRINPNIISVQSFAPGLVFHFAPQVNTTMTT